MVWKLLKRVRAWWKVGRWGGGVVFAGECLLPRGQVEGIQLQITPPLHRCWRSRLQAASFASVIASASCPPSHWFPVELWSVCLALPLNTYKLSAGITRELRVVARSTGLRAAGLSVAEDLTSWLTPCCNRKTELPEMNLKVRRCCFISPPKRFVSLA